jgi:hypothetical protein
MTKRGIRLFPIGLIVLSTALASAQSKVITAADVTDAAPAPAPAPVLPKRPAEMPPKLPKVTCRGDQITISADNSTLDAILAAVKGCTGAKIEIPDGASRVRSFEELGPGPVREVLDQLLSGTQYNYVIQSSEANPAKVETVLLSMRTGDGDKAGSNAISADLPMTAGRRAWQHMQKFDKPDPSMLNADGTMIEADPATPASETTAAQPVEASTSPADAAPSDAAASASATPPPTPVAPPIVQPDSGGDPAKVVQDRISAMQQMFSQRQQMIQKQNQSQSGTPNN